jgi:type II secretory pathway pseudopilin PulG
LIVVAILGILAAVVAVNVLGMVRRGQAETYAVDERTIQSAASIFYADTHAFSGAGGWNEAGNYTPVHNYPTALGTASSLRVGNQTTMGKYNVRLIMNSADNSPATADDIKAAAIWMGLLVNGPGQGGSGPDVTPGAANSPLAGEDGPYLNSVPKSCSKNNSPAGTGTFTWIVGAYGRIYGVFQSGGLWYAGYGGTYP